MTGAQICLLGVLGTYAAQVLERKTEERSRELCVTVASDAVQHPFQGSLTCPYST